MEYVNRSRSTKAFGNALSLSFAALWAYRNKVGQLYIFFRGKKLEVIIII